MFAFRKSEMTALKFAIFFLGVSLITAGAGKWVTGNNLDSSDKKLTKSLTESILLSPCPPYPLIVPYSFVQEIFACWHSLTESLAVCFSFFVVTVLSFQEGLAWRLLSDPFACGCNLPLFHCHDWGSLPGLIFSTIRFCALFKPCILRIHSKEGYWQRLESSVWIWGVLCFGWKKKNESTCIDRLKIAGCISERTSQVSGIINVILYC